MVLVIKTFKKLFQVGIFSIHRCR